MEGLSIYDVEFNVGSTDRRNKWTGVRAALFQHFSGFGLFMLPKLVSAPAAVSPQGYTHAIPSRSEADVPGRDILITPAIGCF